MAKAGEMRHILTVGTPATKHEKDALHVYRILQKYQNEKRYGSIRLMFEKGDLVHVEETSSTRVPKDDS